MDDPGKSLDPHTRHRGSSEEIAESNYCAVAEIPRIIQTLCTAPPAAQRATIETYFTPTASFTHPFCRTGSFAGSIWLIIMIYRWYKILSPDIDVWIDSVGTWSQFSCKRRAYLTVK